MKKTYKMNLQGVANRSTTMTTDNFNDVLDRVAYLEARGQHVTSVYTSADPKVCYWRRVAIRTVKGFKEKAEAAVRTVMSLSEADYYAELNAAYRSL